MMGLSIGVGCLETQEKVAEATFAHDADERAVAGAKSAPCNHCGFSTRNGLPQKGSLFVHRGR